MYEPSDAIIEQLARETCNALFEQHFINKDYDSLPDENKAEIKKYQVLTYVVNLPTINKALELLETKPQWQDKPDKEGWWWGKCLVTNGFCYFMIKVIRHKDGTYGPDRRYENFPVSNYIYYERDAEWLYIPEPEPYKGEE